MQFVWAHEQDFFKQRQKRVHTKVFIYQNKTGSFQKQATVYILTSKLQKQIVHSGHKNSPGQTR